MMILSGLLRYDNFDRIKSVYYPSKELVAVISENINAKYIAFKYFRNICVTTILWKNNFYQYCNA